MTPPPVPSYDGRRFRKADAGPDAPLAQYHQVDDLVWAESAGGDVRRGSVVGTCAPDGTLTIAYSMVLTDGAVVSGRCVSRPEVLADGRIRLHETWERFGPNAEAGMSRLDEIS